MPRLRLFRRRSVPVPTFTGLIVLGVLLCGGTLLGLRHLGAFLAPNEPVGRGILVVEGWLPAEAFRLAAQTYERGAYDALIVSGGPVDDPLCGGTFRTYADRGAAMLRQLGIKEPALATVPAPASAQERSYRSAVSVRQWAEASHRPVTALDVFSYGPHARRTRTLYRMAFGDGVEVGVISAAPSRYELSRWWDQSSAAKDVLAEGFAYAWTLCCFHPGPRGSHEELWAQPEQP